MRWAVVGILLLAGAAGAQPGGHAPLRFDAVSIKPVMPPPDNRFEFPTCQGGRLRSSASVRYLAQWAYASRPEENFGWPGWTEIPSYRIEATAGRPATKAECMLMVETMLADRFGLLMTTEAKEMPVYDLVQSKKGARLHAVTDDNDQSRILVNGGTVFNQERRSRITMAEFAEMLQRHPGVGSPVIDKTGLTGSYTFTLKSSSYPRAPEDAPDLFVAIEDQLGLKLVRSRAQLTVYRVVRINKPRPN